MDNGNSISRLAMSAFLREAEHPIFWAQALLARARAAMADDRSVAAVCLSSNRGRAPSSRVEATEAEVHENLRVSVPSW